MTSPAERTDVPATDPSAGLPSTRRAWEANTKVTGTALLALVAILGASALMSGCESCDKSPSPPLDGGPKDVAGDRIVVSCDKVAAASKPTSFNCVCDKECGSGHCADGVCCDSGCDGKCMACNLPSSLGVCSKVPAGVKPTDAAECKMEAPSSCGQDGTCDGNGGCRQWVKETSCQSGTCDGDGIAAGRVCDGKGNCVAGLAETCRPYTCDPATNKCETSCATRCADGQQCVNKSCGLKLNGATCQASDECSSGFCADHVCCNVACSGACQACNQTGSVGRCQLISAGLPDPDFCKAEDKNTCGTTGLCDEIGSCARFPANITACSEASCVGDTILSSARSCDGQGTCRDAQPLPCSPYRCAAGACNKTCTVDTDCADGHPCVSVPGSSTKQCSGLKMNGLTCAAAAECASGSCVDGVCCESSCGGACRSCAVQGSLGRCTLVAAAAPDPRSICSDTGRTSCGTTGKCDGTGACQKYPVGFTCGDESCGGGNYTPAPTCNNQSQCVSSPARTCAPFVCGGTRCLTVCSTQGMDCVPGQVCLNGSCGLKPNGAYCGGASECQSNHCAQGVCCNATCNGACVACNQAASPGICTAVKDGSADPQATCLITAQTSCGTTGTCQGGGCAFWPSGAKCKDSSCSSINSVTPTSTCTGSGVCKTPNDLPCDKFMCTAGACKTSCTAATSATDCVPPNTCVNGSCGLKADGQPCTAAGECTHGFCTEGVCCNSACSDASGTTGLCRSCKVAGAVGTCTAVASGAADPKSRCIASSTASGDCSNDGTCNGAGACRPSSTSAGCRTASCVGSTLTAAANCNGMGSCMPVQTSTCGNYVCNPTSPSCLTTCTKDADCGMALTCRKVDNKCGTTLSNGEQCGANGDCTSHICSGEGVCCDAACTDGCKSCLVAGKLGMCSGIPAGSTPRVTTTCPPAAPCGNTGKCNGAGACALAGASTSCTVAMTCASATMTSGPASTCDTMGSCAPPAPVACMAGYLCSSGVCATSCTPTDATTTCATGYICMGGHCILPLALGLACSAPGDCASGACVSTGASSVCCATACTTDQPCGTKALCATNGSACLTHAGEDCSVAASCSGDRRSSIGTGGKCSGTGTCTPPTATTSCTMGYLCSAGVCAMTCADNTACDTVMGYACNMATSSCEASGGGGMGGSN